MPEILRKRLLARLNKTTRGAVAIELALLLTALLTLALGAFDGMQMMLAWTGLEQARNEAARYVMAHPTATLAQIQTYAAGRAAAAGVSNATFTVSSSSVGGKPYVTITGTYAYKDPSGLLPMLSRTLSCSTTTPAF